MIAHAERQFFHDAHVVHACTAHGRAFQFHRFEDRHRIDQTGPGRAPFNAFQHRLLLLVRPFESDRIPWELCRPSERFSVGDIIHQEDQSVRRQVIVIHHAGKIDDRTGERERFYFFIVYHIKALPAQPFELFGTGIVKIDAFRRDKRESIKTDMPACRHGRIELSYGTGAEISGILILLFIGRDPGIDLLKIGVTDHGFTAQDQFAGIRDHERNIVEEAGIRRDDLTHFAVSSGHSLEKFSIAVGEYNCQAIHLPGKQPLLVSQPVDQILDIFCLIK